MVILGVNDNPGSIWIECCLAEGNFGWPIYGISGPLVAPTPVPEPGTIGLMLAPALLLLGRYRSRRRRPATPTTPSDLSVR